MLVREAMTTPAVTLGPDDAVVQAAGVLLQHRIASAPVVDGRGSLVGVASEADLLRGRTAPDPRAHLRPVDEGPAEAAGGFVRDVMTSPALSVRGDEDVDRAADLLLGHGLKMLPVVREGRVVGVVARRDLLRTSARTDADVRRDVTRLLTELGQGEGVEVVVSGGVVTLVGGTSATGNPTAAVLARTVPGVTCVGTRGR